MIQLDPSEIKELTIGITKMVVEEYHNQQKPTLRDQFAMAALTGLTANPEHASMGDFDVFARTAYLSADAMLKAREGTK